MDEARSHMQQGIESLPLRPEAMAAAVRAAEAAGISVQDWLTRAILAGAYRSGTSAAKTAAQPSGPFPPSKPVCSERHPALSGSAKVREALARLANREAARGQ